MPGMLHNGSRGKNGYKKTASEYLFRLRGCPEDDTIIDEWRIVSGMLSGSLLAQGADFFIYPLFYQGALVCQH